eukprot:COSAG04_NODE_21704_length_369_cov_0.696296_2_plen_50_part_01
MGDIEIDGFIQFIDLIKFSVKPLGSARPASGSRLGSDPCRNAPPATSLRS